MSAPAALSEITLGSTSCSYLPAKSLKTTTQLSSVLASSPRIRFVGKVGGVAFDAVAVPDSGLVIKSLSLDLDTARPDGSRLVLTVNGRPVKTRIHDWELLPTIRYADSDSTSCFTLFGELQDEEEGRRLRGDGARILNYDDAFQDSLMGLRMFQLDILLLGDDFATDLPKEDGEYILGAGEKSPDLSTAKSLHEKYEEARLELDLKGIREDFDTEFQSYVITDQSVDIRFVIKDGQLEITGEPFYYFWKDDEDDLNGRYQAAQAEEAVKAGVLKPGDGFDELRAMIIKERKADQERKDSVKLKVARELKVISDTGTLEDLEQMETEADEKYEAALNKAVYEIAKAEGKVREGETPESFAERIFEEYMEADASVENAILERNQNWRNKAAENIPEKKAEHAAFKKQMDDINVQVAGINAGPDAAYAALEDKLDEIRDKARQTVSEFQDSDEATGKYLKEFSAAHAQFVDTLAAMNPAVWNAGRTVMRYGAFFRYCRAHHSDAWSAFMQKLGGNEGKLETKPAVKTPTVMKFSPPAGQ
ncbi:MAG TPA: hypothetical protein PK490_12880 [Prosthecobacter sp.]|nr:hypothetical protein [Prosthecobacter sp.]HRK15181.1 hypothetical protein [Prosthecobacter sp.]